MAIGKPCSAANAAATSAEETGSVVPGTVVTPASVAARRAAVLSPIATMTSGGGPTQTSPAAPTARANSAFSARKP
jgi:hypothetical protein